MKTITYEKLTPKMALNLANPPSWAASVLPALFGIAYSFVTRYPLPIWKAFALLLCCILMQSAVNTLNDYFDYKNGTDSKEDVLEINDAVLLYNNINPKHALILGLGFLALGGILGIASAIGSGPIPFGLGVIGALCTLLYSGGKLPISSLPIGELISGVVMGGLIPAAIFTIAKKEFDPMIFLFSIPFMIGIALIMMTNNCCDIEKDIKAGRNTLPSLLGRETTKIIYRVLVIMWMFASWILPCLIIGKIGLFAPLVEYFLTNRDIKFLCKSPLTQENRIEQMKGILRANIKINLIYILFPVYFIIQSYV